MTISLWRVFLVLLLVRQSIVAGVNRILRTYCKGAVHEKGNIKFWREVLRSFTIKSEEKSVSMNTGDSWQNDLNLTKTQKQEHLVQCSIPCSVYEP